MRDAAGHELEAVEVRAQIVLEIISLQSAIFQLQSRPLSLISAEDELVVICEVVSATLIQNFLGCHPPEYALVASLADDLLECSLHWLGFLFELEAIRATCVKDLGVLEILLRLNGSHSSYFGFSVLNANLLSTVCR